MEDGQTRDVLPVMRLRRVFRCSRTFWILRTKQTNNNNNNNKGNNKRKEEERKK